MLDINFLSELTIVIPWLPCLFSVAKSVPSTVELVNSVTSDSVDSFNFALCASTSKCFPIELSPCSDGWQRTWWQMIHRMPGLPLSSIPQCKWKCHKGACFDSFKAFDPFKSVLIAVQDASNIICTVRSLKSQTKSFSFLDDIITPSLKVLKYLESDILVGIWKLHNSTWDEVTRLVIVKWIIVCSILAPELRAR